MVEHTPIEVTKKCNLTDVLQYLKDGLTPSQIISFKLLTKRKTYYALNKLLKQGSVKMIARGVYEVTKSHHVASTHTPIEVTKVRCHGVVATLKIRNLRNWNNRKRTLTRLKIEHKDIQQGQQIILDHVKIWLTNKSIVFYLPYSWFDETARKSAYKCLNYLIGLIEQLEKKLKVSSFKIYNKYSIRFSRHHYALIKNELARQYNLEKKKLFVYDEKGLWLLIDNSYNLNELETVHPKTAIDDNETVQDAFNSIKQGVTPQFLMERIGEVTDNQQMFNRNFKTHVSVLKALEKAVNKLTDKVDKK